MRKAQRRAASRNGAMTISENDHSSRTRLDTQSNRETDWWIDRNNIFVLVLLYAIQGLPIGFVFGSIPFLLKEKVRFDGIALFSFAGWPYAMKLLIAPVVDSVYSKKIGRRKSWIVPVQAASGFLFFALASNIERWLNAGDVYRLTPVFFTIMLFTATQDVAVDAWALTLLQPKNLPYASTCQSIGLSLGSFTSFTLFLALQNPSFCDSYVRPWLGGIGSLLSLSQMLQFVGCIYVVLTICIFALKTELPAPKVGKDHLPMDLSLVEANREDSGNSSSYRSAILNTYKDLIRVVQLPAIRQLLLLLLIVKTGFSAYDNVFALKLLDLGFPKETMAMMTVLQSPFTLVGSVISGRLAAKYGPLFPYMNGFYLRFLMSMTGVPLVMYFTALGGVPTPFFFMLLLSTSVLYSIANDCLMFVSMGALFLSISEQGIAGSYLTLLNTISNLGGMWHTPIVLYLVDRLTFRTNCSLPVDSLPDAKCPTIVDGYTLLSVLLAIIAVRTGIFARKSLRRLESLPESAWHVSTE